MGSPPGCDRARFSLSLALDGELSELEQAALNEHLRGCAACAAFARDAAVFTAAMREAPTELPERVLTAPGRRPGVRPVLVAAAVATVVVAAGLGGLAGWLSGPGSARPTRAALAESSRPLIQQQVLALNLVAPRSSAARGKIIAD